MESNQRRENVPSPCRVKKTPSNNKSIDNHPTPKVASVKYINWRDNDYNNYQVRSNLPPNRQSIHNSDKEEARRESRARTNKALLTLTLPEENLRFLLFIPKHRPIRHVLADFRRFGPIVNLTILPDRGQWDTLEKNSTTTRSVVLAGKLDKDSHCESGDNYDDPYGTFTDVLVTGYVSIGIYDYDIKLNLESDKVFMQDGTPCNAKASHCISGEGGNVFWDTLPRADMRCK
ncbi:unnamed protein product [Trichogramma brassicae]|uniref:Uncharacterized protein n=1 Tax=Trichogramma brassicae TaxID=86971 RepID=A0A6H5I1J6_9HYME|nr:unnamed protein product [Trichogramma brassicae]